MERSPPSGPRSPSPDPEHKEPQEAPRPPDSDRATAREFGNIDEVVSYADADSTPLARTQRASTAGTQAAEERTPGTRLFDDNLTAVPIGPNSLGSPPQLTTPELGIPSTQSHSTAGANDHTALASNAGLQTAAVLGMPTWFAPENSEQDGHVLRHLANLGRRL